MTSPSASDISLTTSTAATAQEPQGDFAIIARQAILDEQRDVYGYEARVEFLAFLRGEEKFSNLDDLIAQMKIDEQQARAFLKDYKSKHNK